MKIILVLFTLLFSFHQTSAQFEKGKFAVGLNLGFYYDNDQQNMPTNSIFSVASDLHGEYFFHRNLSVITGFEFDHKNQFSTRKETDSLNNPIASMEVTVKERTIAPLLGIRKYWFSTDGKFGFFVMPYALASFATRKMSSTFTSPKNQVTYERRNDSWSPYFKINIGACYFFKPNFSVEITSLLLQAYVDGNQQYVYVLRDLSNFRLGVRYYF